MALPLFHPSPPVLGGRTKETQEQSENSTGLMSFLLSVRKTEAHLVFQLRLPL